MNIDIKQAKINDIRECIKIIDDQINTFVNIQQMFFQKKKIQEYNNRIEKLESIKIILYKSLEYNVDNIK